MLGRRATFIGDLIVGVDSVNTSRVPVKPRGANTLLATSISDSTTRLESRYFNRVARLHCGLL